MFLLMRHVNQIPFNLLRSITRLIIVVAILVVAACDNFNDSVVNNQQTSQQALQVTVLSSRPDMVSGGDALIEVRAEGSTQVSELSLLLNGKTITDVLSTVEEGGIYRGLITGMESGENHLQVFMTASEDAPVEIVLTNYPTTGPIISGPHLSPYECRTEEADLGQALDDNCSAAQKIEYFYRSTDGEFKPMPAEKPDDIAMTTTNQGVTVPYIVRVDSGTINRTIYRIAILDDGNTSGEMNETSWKPSDVWNKRLGVSFGGGAGTNYNQGVNQATGALNDTFLSRGFAFMISSELVNRQHANAILQGETLMMLKEYFIENYGLPVWTVGNGGSGGAIQQLLITQLFPGLLDGIRPSLAYPDSTLHTADCGSLQNYWSKDEAGVWTDEKKEAVSGFSGGTCRSWERSFVPVLRATNISGCGLKEESLVYHPDTNPTGARCTIQEMRANFYGRDPDTHYARKPQDNVGLQYGLGALNRGSISIEEFLHLNANIGGNDLDGEFVTDRSVGDPIAIRAAYHFGFIDSGAGGLANVPILHYRDYRDPLGDIHDRHRDLTIRARLEKANGRSDNQVIWVAPYRERGVTPEVDIGALSLDVMTEWLDKLVTDSAPLSTDKVVKNKPAAAVDACWSKDFSEKIIEVASLDNNTRCNTLYPVHSEPRLVAGAPLTNDIMKCQLKPIDYSDYKVEFNNDQKQQLSRIFPEGVCDFSKTGIEQVALGVGWPQY